jgi:hypothetical protein
MIIENMQTGSLGLIRDQFVSMLVIAVIVAHAEA